MSRDEVIGAFLADAGWGGARRSPLAGDASLRRYERLDRAGDRAILMDIPPEAAEDIGVFADMTGRLRGAGYSAPAILAARPDDGLMLLEDLGDDLFARIIPGGAAEMDLYAAAVDLLADLVGRPALASGLPAYDRAFYLTETAILADWYLPEGTPDALRVAYRDAVGGMLDRLSGAGPVCVLRDYHALNLIWLPDRTGLARVGLLDYQGALAGHPAYDLMSLLTDARRDVDPRVAQAMEARFATATGIDSAQLSADLAILGAQRNLKILGIFARLARRDGKPGYLSLLPRVRGHLDRALAHPALAESAPVLRAVLAGATP